MTPTKEQVYDEEISPLMTRIIAICQNEGIAMLASYHIPNEEDDQLMCSTHLENGDGDFHPKLSRACAVIRSGTTTTPPMMITTTAADGFKTLTAIL